MAGYKDRTVTLDFDWLADGCKVVLLNPRLMSFDPKEWADLEQDDRNNRRLASLVREWHVPDPKDETGATMLPSPVDDPSVFQRCPVEVARTIYKVWLDSLDPLVERTTIETSSSTSSASSKAPGED